MRGQLEGSHLESEISARIRFTVGGSHCMRGNAKAVAVCSEVLFTGPLGGLTEELFLISVLMANILIWARQ